MAAVSAGLGLVFFMVSRSKVQSISTRACDGNVGGLAVPQFARAQFGQQGSFCVGGGAFEVPAEAGVWSKP